MQRPPVINAVLKTRRPRRQPRPPPCCPSSPTSPASAWWAGTFGRGTWPWGRQKGRERGAIKDLDYGHNYENVYDDDDDDEGIERGRRHSEKGRAALYRSKSCDRAGVRGAVRDQVSLKGSCWKFLTVI